MTALNDHISNMALHSGGGSGGGPVVGTYSGNSATQQMINLGFQPKFGIVFVLAPDHPITMNSGGTSHTWAFGFVSEAGDSFGIESTTTGFRARHLAGSTAGGNFMGMNTTGQTYAYVMWR
jgi:hypothetical protein